MLNYINICINPTHRLNYFIMSPNGFTYQSTLQLLYTIVSNTPEIFPVLLVIALFVHFSWYAKTKKKRGLRLLDCSYLTLFLYEFALLSLLSRFISSFYGHSYDETDCLETLGSDSALIRVVYRAETHHITSHFGVTQLVIRDQSPWKPLVNTSICSCVTIKRNAFLFL